jgi:FKBP-type peptidyl-prolyl cis-trans isomerase FklB
MKLQESALRCISGLLLIHWTVVAQTNTPPTPLIATPSIQAVSYGIGVDIARHFRRLGIDVDEEEVRRGFADGLSGDRLRIPESEVRRIIIQTQTEGMRRNGARRQSPAALNKFEAESFLERNAARPGVVTLPGGLQYRILKPGAGPTPNTNQTTVVHFRITRMDGAEFMASDPAKPIHVKPAEAQPKAWAEALPRMPKGARWRLFVPPSLGYGAAGLGKEIGPEMGLIYDLELVDFH